jgi:hypothetical protein
MDFSGSVAADKIHVGKIVFDQVSASVKADPKHIVLSDMTIQYLGGQGSSPKVELKKESKGWELTTKDFIGKNFKTAGQTDDPSLTIDSFELHDLIGVLGSSEPLKAHGDFSFTNFPIKNPAQFIPATQQEILGRLGLTPQSLLPIGGAVYFEIKDNKIILTKLKDVHTENRLFRFTLAKTGPSLIDFAGNLDLNIGIQPYNLLLRSAEVFSFKVDGTMLKPIFNFPHSQTQ